MADDYKPIGDEYVDPTLDSGGHSKRASTYEPAGLVRLHDGEQYIGKYLLVRRYLAPDTYRAWSVIYGHEATLPSEADAVAWLRQQWADVQP